VFGAKVHIVVSVIVFPISCFILQISPDGIANRDEKVFRFARERNIPIVMLTSGSLSL
jgi:hypothetical protein